MTANIQTQIQPGEHHAMQAEPRWQDGSILVLAGILFLSPWIFGTATHAASSWNAWIAGIGFVPLLLRTFAPPPGAYANQCEHERVRIAWWQKLLDSCHLSHIAKEELVVGAWLIAAPWVLGFAAMRTAAWTASIIGILIVILAMWKLRELRGQ